MTSVPESQQFNRLNPLGLIVWHLRLKNGLSLSRLAAATDLDQEFLERLEQGREVSAPANVMLAIARALKVHVLTLTNSDSMRLEARAHWLRAQRKRKPK